jgi:hypothetical protein
MNDQLLKQEHSLSADKQLEGDLETLIDLVWNDLQGHVSRAAVQQVLLAIIPEYEDATIATFVPIRQPASKLGPGCSRFCNRRPLPKRTVVGHSPQRCWRRWGHL